MRWLVVGLSLIFLTTGCSSTNIAELVKALAEDPNPNCVVAGYGPAGVMIARGSPLVHVKLTPGGCELLGNNVTTVTVPTSNVSVQQPK